MSKSNAYETALLQHEFQNADIALIGDAAGLLGSAVAGSLYLSLHTADPGEAGSSQSTNEVSYTGYARVAVARSAGGFTVTGDTVTNAADITFGKRTDAGAAIVATYWALGTASSGAGSVLRRGVIGAGRKVFTATVADVITAPGNTLIVNDTVIFFAFPGATLPTGITEGTIYFVLTVSANDITISATLGGATLNITAAGAGGFLKASPITIAENSIPQCLQDALTITED